MPSSVLHVAQPVDGGVAAYVSRLARTQREMGWRVAAACPRSQLSLALQESGVEWFEWRAVRAPGPWVLSETRSLRRIVDSVAPEVMHLHSAKAGLAGRLLKHRRPTIFQPHAWSWDAVDGVAQFPVKAWERYAAPRCDQLVCISEEERERGVAAGLKARWRVVDNAVDLAAFPVQGAEEKTKARADLGLPNSPIALCVAPLRRQKGQDILVGAWSSVRNEVPEALLVLVGDGSERRQLEELAGPGVMFAGHQDDVLPWLAAADVVAVPSRWDGGMSLAMLEAMSCGRSIVANETQGVRRVLDGAGEIVGIGDQQALAWALIRRFRDPDLIAREAAIARRLVESRFHWGRLMQDMNDVYASAMSDQP